MKHLIKQLPEGEITKSIHSPRTIILMKYERLRREFNRKNDENLSMKTFLCVHFSRLKQQPINSVNPLAWLTVEIMAFKRDRYYLHSAIYNNNFKVL